MITYTILGVPYYKYSTMGSQNPILIIAAPILFSSASPRSSEKHQSFQKDWKET